MSTSEFLQGKTDLSIYSMFDQITVINVAASELESMYNRLNAHSNRVQPGEFDDARSSFYHSFSTAAVDIQAAWWVQRLGSDFWMQTFLDAPKHLQEVMEF